MALRCSLCAVQQHFYIGHPGVVFNDSCGERKLFFLMKVSNVNKKEAKKKREIKMASLRLLSIKTRTGFMIKPKHWIEMKASHWTWLGLHCVKLINIHPYYCPDLTLLRTVKSVSLFSVPINFLFIPLYLSVILLSRVLRAFTQPCGSECCSLGGIAARTSPTPSSILCLVLKHYCTCTTNYLINAEVLGIKVYWFRCLFREPQDVKGTDTER